MCRQFRCRLVPTVVPEHRLDQLIVINLRPRLRQRGGSTPQYRDIIGDLERFAQFVRNEDYCAPGVCKLAELSEQLIDLSGREDSGWLVENQSARVSRKKFE